MLVPLRGHPEQWLGLGAQAFGLQRCRNVIMGVCSVLSRLKVEDTKKNREP